MKIRLILEDRAWEYSLRVRQSQPGRYYVELCSLSGATLRPAIFTGSFRSLDLIVDAAPALYLQLVAMKESADRPVTAAMLEAPLTAHVGRATAGRDRHQFSETHKPHNPSAT